MKSCDEDTRFGKILREEPVGERLCFPAANDTTSEPTAGNSCPGAPVIASGKGRAHQQVLSARNLRVNRDLQVADILCVFQNL